MRTLMAPTDTQICCTMNQSVFFCQELGHNTESAHITWPIPDPTPDPVPALWYTYRIFLQINRWKNFDNQSRFAKVINRYQLSGILFWDTILCAVIRPKMHSYGYFTVSFLFLNICTALRLINDCNEYKTFLSYLQSF